jgi:hypothetical protein
MTKSCFYVATLLMVMLMTGCESHNQPPGPSLAARANSQSKSAAAPAASDISNQWLGKWIGPEGTYLVLSKKADQYVVEINSLDGSSTYVGTSAGDHIEFQRNGKTESIHAGSGEDTGMKWLLDKKNCLIIKTGEGFCRN